MASHKIICIEHELRIGGCDCNGALISKAPCTGKHLPESKAKPFSLNPEVVVEPSGDGTGFIHSVTRQAPEDYEQKAREAYEARKGQT